jgi:hypothetical protein
MKLNIHTAGLFISILCAYVTIGWIAPFSLADSWGGTPTDGLKNALGLHLIVGLIAWAIHGMNYLDNTDQ